MIETLIVNRLVDMRTESDRKVINVALKKEKRFPHCHSDYTTLSSS